MDPQDYISVNAIGPNHIEVSAEVWENMKDVAQNTTDAIVNSSLQFLKIGAEMVLSATKEGDKQALDQLLNQYNSAIRKFITARNILFNSLIPEADQETTFVDTEMPYFVSIPIESDTGLPLGTLSVKEETVIVTIDYTGKTTFEKSYQDELIAAITALNAVFKKILSLFTGATDTQLSTPSVAYNGVCAINA